MKYIVFLICFFLLRCSLEKTNINESIDCASSFYFDSLLVSKEADSFIRIENYRSDESFKIISKSNYCISPIIKNNHIYYLKNDSTIDCVNLETRKSIAEFKTYNEINNIKTFDNFLVINIRRQGVKVLKLTTLEPVTTFDKIETENCNDMLVNDFILKGNSMFISDFNCNNILCVDLNTNKVKWAYKSNFAATRILLCDTVLFCGMTGDPRKKEGNIILINPINGKQLYETKEPFDLVVNPIRYLNYVFFVTYDGKIKKLNLLNKEITIAMDLDKIKGICDNQLYLQDRNIYFSNCSNDIYNYDIEANKISVFKKSESKLINVFKFEGRTYLKTAQDKSIYF